MGCAGEGGGSGEDVPELEAAPCRAGRKGSARDKAAQAKAAKAAKAAAAAKAAEAAVEAAEVAARMAQEQKAVVEAARLAEEQAAVASAAAVKWSRHSASSPNTGSPQKRRVSATLAPLRAGPKVVAH